MKERSHSRGSYCSRAAEAATSISMTNSYTSFSSVVNPSCDDD